MTIFTAYSALADELPPFEKIYVSPYEILSTPYGRYYRSPCGTQIPISKVSNDNDGLYIIIIKKQCPNCGRYHYGNETAQDGFNCTFDQN